MDWVLDSKIRGNRISTSEKADWLDSPPLTAQREGTNEAPRAPCLLASDLYLTELLQRLHQGLSAFSSESLSLQRRE